MNATNLENQLIAFDNWSQPYTFFKTISEKLSPEELILFKEIWEKASDTEIWRIHDLILACKITQTFVRDNYGLDDKAIAQIVRAITYDWK